ncbi:hypothetical protein [uncultured Draconibacterium sp.]|nr:hypothetical protein [uncultured Draconibacterium sp.]
MKKGQFQSTENTFEVCGFEVINEEAMNNIRGGVEPPKSRDKDIFDFEEE